MYLEHLVRAVCIQELIQPKLKCLNIGRVPEASITVTSFCILEPNQILRNASGKELYQGSYHKLVDLSPDVGNTCMSIVFERMLKAEGCQKVRCQQ